MSTTARLRIARSDADHLAGLLATEHGAMAEFLLALAAFDAARGWAELGHPSLFAFLHVQLRLSKASAYHRAAAARLVRQFPAVAESLRAGRLCLTSTAELARVLTAENEGTVLPRFFGLSSREAKELVVELVPHPAPPLRELVTVAALAPDQARRPVEAVRAHEPAPPSTPRELGGSLFDAAPAALPATTSPASEPELAAETVLPIRSSTPARPADEAVPFTADLRRLHVTVSRRFLEKVEAAKEARSHARQGATTEEILEEALDLLLAREAKRRIAATDRPRRAPERLAQDDGGPRTAALTPAVPGAPDPALDPAIFSDDNPVLPPLPGAPRQHLPAQVRREVWTRDGGRCTWPRDGGGTCGSTHRLQVDHTLAAARGGPPTAANLRILCEAHNKEAARRTFGPGWMVRFGASTPRRTG